MRNLLRYLVLSALSITALSTSLPALALERQRSDRDERMYQGGRRVMGAIGQRVLRAPGAGRATREAYDVGGRFQNRYQDRLQNFGRDRVGPLLRGRPCKERIHDGGNDAYALLRSRSPPCPA